MVVDMFTEKLQILLILLGLVIFSCKSDKAELSSEREKFEFIQNDSLISIQRIGNHCSVKKKFNIPESTTVRLTSCGEIIIGQKNDKRDVLEIYIDLNNEKRVGFNSKANKFFFFSEIGGSSSNVHSEFRNVSETVYNVEIAFPWEALNLKASPGKIIGFDFALTDNDNGFEQEKQIAWHSIDSDIWLNSSLWGNLLLAKETNDHVINDSTIVSVRTNVKPVIDGQKDDLYENHRSYLTKKILYGDVKNNDGEVDIRGELVSSWDYDNLYLFIVVKDDRVVKQSFMGKEFDYGSLVGADGKVIWKMDRSNSYYSGGALKNHCADTIFSINAGTYYLCYRSDESHSYENWDDDPPSGNFYGISLTMLR